MDVLHLQHRELGGCAVGPRSINAALCFSEGLVRRLKSTTSLQCGVATTALSWDDAGTLLAAAGEDCTVRLYKGACGSVVQSFDPGHTDPILCAGFFPGTGGRTLVTAGPAKDIRVTDLERQAVRPYSSHACPVKSILPLSNSVFAAGGEDGTLRYYDSRERDSHNDNNPGVSRSLLVDQRYEATGRVGAKVSIHAMSQDPMSQQYIATGGGDALVRVYDVRMIRQPQVGPFMGYSRSSPPPWCYCLAPSALRAEAHRESRLRNHQISSIAFDHTGQRMLAGYAGHGIYSVDTRQHACSYDQLFSHRTKAVQPVWGPAVQPSTGSGPRGPRGRRAVMSAVWPTQRSQSAQLTGLTTRAGSAAASAAAAAARAAMVAAQRPRGGSRAAGQTVGVGGVDNTRALQDPALQSGLLSAQQQWQLQQQQQPGGSRSTRSGGTATAATTERASLRDEIMRHYLRARRTSEAGRQQTGGAPAPSQATAAEADAAADTGPAGATQPYCQQFPGAQQLQQQQQATLQPSGRSAAARQLTDPSAQRGTDSDSGGSDNIGDTHATGDDNDDVMIEAEVHIIGPDGRVLQRATLPPMATAAFLHGRRTAAAPANRQQGQQGAGGSRSGQQQSGPAQQQQQGPEYMAGPMQLALQAAIQHMHSRRSVLQRQHQPTRSSHEQQQEQQQQHVELPHQQQLQHLVGQQQQQQRSHNVGMSPEGQAANESLQGPTSPVTQAVQAGPSSTPAVAEAASLPTAADIAVQGDVSEASPQPLAVSQVGTQPAETGMLAAAAAAAAAAGTAGAASSQAAETQQLAAATAADATGAGSGLNPSAANAAGGCHSGGAGAMQTVGMVFMGLGGELAGSSQSIADISPRVTGHSSPIAAFLAGRDAAAPRSRLFLSSSSPQRQVRQLQQQEMLQHGNAGVAGHFNDGQEVPASKRARMVSSQAASPSGLPHQEPHNTHSQELAAPAAEGAVPFCQVPTNSGTSAAATTSCLPATAEMALQTGAADAGQVALAFDSQPVGAASAGPAAGVTADHAAAPGPVHARRERRAGRYQPYGLTSRGLFIGHSRRGADAYARPAYAASEVPSIEAGLRPAMEHNLSDALDDSRILHLTASPPSATEGIAAQPPPYSGQAITALLLQQQRQQQEGPGLLDSSFAAPSGQAASSDWMSSPSSVSSQQATGVAARPAVAGNPFPGHDPAEYAGMPTAGLQAVTDVQHERRTQLAQQQQQQGTHCSSYERSSQAASGLQGNPPEAAGIAAARAAHASGSSPVTGYEAGFLGYNPASNGAPSAAARAFATGRRERHRERQLHEQQEQQQHQGASPGGQQQLLGESNIEQEQRHANLGDMLFRSMVDVAAAAEDGDTIEIRIEHDCSDGAGNEHYQEGSNAHAAACAAESASSLPAKAQAQAQTIDEKLAAHVGSTAAAEHVGGAAAMLRAELKLPCLGREQVEQELQQQQQEQLELRHQRQKQQQQQQQQRQHQQPGRKSNSRADEQPGSSRALQHAGTQQQQQHVKQTLQPQLQLASNAVLQQQQQPPPANHQPSSLQCSKRKRRHSDDHIARYSVIGQAAVAGGSVLTGQEPPAVSDAAYLAALSGRSRYSSSAAAQQAGSRAVTRQRRRPPAAAEAGGGGSTSDECSDSDAGQLNVLPAAYGSGQHLSEAERAAAAVNAEEAAVGDSREATAVTAAAQLDGCSDSSSSCIGLLPDVEPLSDYEWETGDCVCEAESQDNETARGYSCCYTGHRNVVSNKNAVWMGSKSQYVVSGSDDGCLFVWSASNGEVVAVLRGGSKAVKRVQVNPHQLLLASCGSEPLVRLWSPEAEHAADSLHTAKQLAANQAATEDAANDRHLAVHGVLGVLSQIGERLMDGLLGGSGGGAMVSFRDGGDGNGGETRLRVARQTSGPALPARNDRNSNRNGGSDDMAMGSVGGGPRLLGRMFGTSRSTMLSASAVLAAQRQQAAESTEAADAASAAAAARVGRHARQQVDRDWQHTETPDLSGNSRGQQGVSHGTMPFGSLQSQPRRGPSTMRPLAQAAAAAGAAAMIAEHGPAAATANPEGSVTAAEVAGYAAEDWVDGGMAARGPDAAHRQQQQQRRPGHNGLVEMVPFGLMPVMDMPIHMMPSGMPLGMVGPDPFAGMPGGLGGLPQSPGMVAAGGGSIIIPLPGGQLLFPGPHAAHQQQQQQEEGDHNQQQPHEQPGQQQ